MYSFFLQIKKKIHIYIYIYIFLDDIYDSNAVYSVCCRYTLAANENHMVLNFLKYRYQCCCLCC